MPKTLKKCQRLYHDLLQADDEACENEQKNSETGPGPATQANRKKKRKIVVPITALDIHFEECPVGRDLERPHQNRSLMSKWVGIVPHPEENPAYAFNVPVFGHEYAEAPYIPQLISASRPKIKEVLQTELHRKDQIKSAIVVKCLYLLTKKDKEEREDSDDFANKVYKVKYHRGEMRPILLEGDIDEHITLTVGEIDKQVEEALLKGSGYTLEQIEEISIEAYTLNRGTGGSFIPTPKKLANTKCTINPDNKGLIDPETNALSEKCLQGALGCYFAHQDQPDTDHLERIFRAKNLKPYLDIVKLDGIPMPTPICSRIFDKIEEMNPDITISVWEWKEETATPKPVIVSKNFNKRKHKIRLLALTDITKSEDKHQARSKYGQKNHFLWIKNPSRLIYGDSAHKEKKYLCDGCTQSCPSEKSLEHHLEWCPGIHENAPQRVTMPVKGVNDFEKFKNYGRMIYAPCEIIADFEAENKKCDEAYGGSMRKLAEQKANSFCYLVHWIDTGDIWGLFLYRGENATQEFVRRIDQELVKINEILAIKHERIETEEDKKRFAEAISCWICKGKFDIDTNEIKRLEDKITYLKEKLKNFKKESAEYNGIQTTIDKATKAIASEKAKANKVWDHCHITGKFRGSAHRDCNLKLQIQDWKTPIPVIFHNFRGYDSHLVCESVGWSANAIQIRVIAETFERYKSMKVGQLKYIDSMQFMNSSLASLTKNLGDNHPITTKHFKELGYTDKQLDLVYRKGVNPYDYIDSHDKFLETELPLYHEFHSTLKGKITLDDYQHAQKVWKEFGCQNLGEYHDLYLKTDVLSLADVWTEFRKMSMEYYELDPSHYVSAPSLSWDANLKMTGVRIELFTDIAMHDFTEKAKRGGISMACQRYFKANNPKMGEDYDPSKSTSWISYVDATNLYGHSMSQYLPIRNYQWEASREYLLKNPAMQKKYLEKILNIRSDAKRGYFLNINAHFPLKTHEYLKDLPPAVENVAVEKDWLCPYNAKLVEQLDGGRFSVTKKLVPHLGSRKNYVIHYQELQYYVKLGMVVDKVSEILSFDQTNWLEPYISFNTEKRNEAKKARNTFLSDFFKLMNVSVYGKTMENVRKYQDVKIMKNNNERDEKAFLKKVRNPSFKYARQLGPTLIGAHMGKASVTLNKPIIVGVSVLGLSKLHMYKFWYGYWKEKYGDDVELGYMDTDSYIIKTKTADIYKDMSERPDLFNLNGDQTVGKYKDETPGNVISLSMHIRSKSYHYVLADKSTQSKHKGVSKKGMGEMATDTYMPTLEGSLLDDPVDRSSMSEQETRDLAMRARADPMTLVYQDCLFDKKVFYAKNVGIRSKDHILSLVESEKKALCPIDTKRWILSDGITTLPYGHWRNMIYKNMIKDGILHEEAEKRAMRAKLPEKYQNECVSHISSYRQ